MQYMLVFFEPLEKFELRNQEESSKEYWGAWMAYIQEMQGSGQMVSGNGLLGPETATTVKVRDGKRTLHDGPFVEAKEALGGFFVIDVPDLDAALAWAAKSPAAHYGGVEVRPVMPSGESPAGC